MTMSLTCSPAVGGACRRHVLAAALALALAASSACGTGVASEQTASVAAVAYAANKPVPHTATWPVTSCADDGSSSTLRWVIENAAASGDVIDASGLSCSTITLASGEIAIDLDSLTIEGPSRGYLTIDAGNTSRIFNHHGTGQLELDNILVTDGRATDGASDTAEGGCLRSDGSLVIKNGAAKYCHAENYGAFGGAIYAAGMVTLSHSRVTLGYAHATGRFAEGGGVWSREGFISKYSTVSENEVYGDVGYYGEGGGVMTYGESTLDHSTVSYNTADVSAGADFNTGSTILNSTVANNISRHSYYGSGLFLGGDTTLANSTVSGNIERNGRNQKYGAGVFVRAGYAIDMESTAVGGNMLYNTADQEYLSDDMGASAESAAIGGANNLVQTASQELQLPPDTLREPPALGPLADNGGETATMMPLSDSPLIGAGNVAVSPNACEQRGPGFPRVVDGRVDIGAVESETAGASDRIFANGFDPAATTCPG